MIHSPVLALLVRLQLVLDHTDHDLIRDQSTGIHDLLGLLAELGLLADLVSEHVTGSQVADAVLLLQVGGLSTLAWRRIEMNTRETSLFRSARLHFG